jgi:flagellar biosynthesis protein FliQ
MLTDRIIGAFTFRKGVYAEVEHDQSFTSTAWLLVAGVAFLNRIGGSAAESLLTWLVGAVLGAIFTVLGFALGAFIVSVIGRALFQAEVTFDEMVRTLGLAYVWNVVGVVGALGAVSPALGCLLGPAVLVGLVLGLIAWFRAAKEALDLDWGPTIITVILGYVILFAISWLGSVLVNALGAGPTGVSGPLF